MAEKRYIPDDGIYNRYFTVDTAGVCLDAFISQVREAYDRLELFGPEQCEPNSFEKLNYEGKVLVLAPGYSEGVLLERTRPALAGP